MKFAIKTLLLGLLLGIFLFSACTLQSNNFVKTSFEKFSNTGIEKFSSTEELLTYLDSNKDYNNYYSYSGSNMMADKSFAMSKFYTNSPTTENSDSTSKGIISYDYSSTNIQVKNVDEADFVKNDEKYIYTISNNKLTIVDAYPVNDAKIVSETDLEGNSISMFLRDNKIIIFSKNYDYSNVFSKYDIMPKKRSFSITKIFVYDVSDKEKPKIIEEFTVEGDFSQARMINNYIYFITKESVYRYDNYINLPEIKSLNGNIITPNIYHFPNPKNNYFFHTIASINLDDLSIRANSYLMGYSNNLYVSENNIYITYLKNYPKEYLEKEAQIKFFNIEVPLLPSPYKEQILHYKNTKSSWNKISEILNKMMNEIPESESEIIYEKIITAQKEYDAKVLPQKQKTIIQKISINKGKIIYEATGEVKGIPLNQFSMDENNNSFRIATTTNLWSRNGRIQFNNVYVLNGNMKIIGKLEEIAPDEKIYSARFLGNKLYLVTFKRIDPLFVIDLSNPNNPEILGELKIPGFSDYLHPYDENHIIGIGKETKDNQWGGLSIEGMKISLFDVSDVNNPLQIANYTIGGRGTDSEALYEHKAFLFDKEKNLLVIPIKEVNYNLPKKNNYKYYYDIWQGAYAFSITPKLGISLRGKISHESIFEQDNYWYRSPYAVRRSLFIDNILYTISDKKIVMNKINDMEKVNQIILSENIKNYPDPVPYY